MHDLRFANWQAPYQAALSEPDEGKLAERVDAAEAAILRRLQNLPSARDCHVELHAIDAALINLLILKTETHTLSHRKADSLENCTARPYRPN
jgi:hypothetical protein